MIDLPAKYVGVGLAVGALVGGFLGYMYGEKLAIAAFGSLGLLAGGAAASAIARLKPWRR